MRGDSFGEAADHGVIHAVITTVRKEMLILIFPSIGALQPRAAFEVGFDVSFIYYGSGDIFLMTASDTPLKRQAWK